MDGTQEINMSSPMNPHTYQSSISWQEGRKGVLAGDGRQDLPVATPPEFGGPAGFWSPEDLYVASENACFMMTFLHLAEKTDIKLSGFNSRAEGTLEFVNGKFKMTRIHLHAVVSVADPEDRERVGEVLQKARQYCLISNSMSTEITVESEIF